MALFRDAGSMAIKYQKFNFHQYEPMVTAEFSSLDSITMHHYSVMKIFGETSTKNVKMPQMETVFNQCPNCQPFHTW